MMFTDIKRVKKIYFSLLACFIFVGIVYFLVNGEKKEVEKQNLIIEGTTTQVEKPKAKAENSANPSSEKAIFVREFITKYYEYNQLSPNVGLTNSKNYLDANYYSYLEKELENKTTIPAYKSRNVRDVKDMTVEKIDGGERWSLTVTCSTQNEAGEHLGSFDVDFIVDVTNESKVISIVEKGAS